MSDRTVHAEHPSGEQIVRYDRAGKWYIELVAPHLEAPRRKQVKLAEAALRARYLEDRGGKIYRKVPGGDAFERKAIRPTYIPGPVRDTDMFSGFF